MDDTLDTTRSSGMGHDETGAGSGHLLVFDGERATRRDLPRNGFLLLGQAPECDLVLSDLSVSRRHARMSIDNGAISIADLDSHNGVRVNGESIHAARPLATGDVISIGKVSLVLHATSTPAPRLIEDAGRIQQRLEEEVERGLRYERPLAVVAISPGAEAPYPELSQALRRALRCMDVAGWGVEGQLWVLFPELQATALTLAMERLLAALLPLAPALKLGLARCPNDGVDAATLLAAARAAAAAASPGGMQEASALVMNLQLGERSVVVADPAMVRVFELLRRLAASELPILITGETGTGKEDAAFAVHFWSRRGNGPFVPINCAAIPETLVESELFGHEKGAFTGATVARPGLFESASGGTVFLDEVGELQMPVQAKLLRVLETRRILRVGGTREREIDLRIVAATNRRLEEEMAAGRFRQDLYFRLGVASVALPPLRERPREIGILAERFLSAACAAGGRPPLALAPATLALLGRYDWPGNVRELKTTVEFLVATVEEEQVEPWHLPARVTAAREVEEEAGMVVPSSPATPAPAGAPGRSLPEELRAIERERMAQALRATGGVKTRAAERLGMPMRTFTLKCKQYGL